MSDLRVLPEAPSLENVKHQARSLHKALIAGDASATARLAAHHPGYRPTAKVDSTRVTLADAQHIVAREYGFESWPKLKAHVTATATLSADAVERFKEAVNAGDATRVGRILRQNPALKSHIDDPWFSFGAPAIVVAAGRQDRQLLGVLLKAGANVDARSEWSPGSWGVLDSADATTAAFLIKHGAHVDIHAAAKQGMIDRVKELVAADPACVNARGGDGMTPLHAASTVEICKFLIDHGADLEIRDLDHNATGAQWSIHDPGKLRYLLDRGATADIFIACRLGDTEIAGRLLRIEPGCLRWGLDSPEYQWPSGHIYVYQCGVSARPLSLAADYAGPDFHRFLLEQGSPEDRLLLGCYLGDGAIIQDVLRESPGLVERLAPSDFTLLCDAAWENRLDAVRLMLDAGFNVDIRGRENATALDRAAVRGWLGLVSLLIERGAALDLVNVHGGWPLTACIWGSENWPRAAGDHAACVEALIGAGSKLPDQLFGSPEVQEVLKRHGVGGNANG